MQTKPETNATMPTLERGSDSIDAIEPGTPTTCCLYCKDKGWIQSYISGDGWHNAAYYRCNPCSPWYSRNKDPILVA